MSHARLLIDPAELVAAYGETIADNTDLLGDIINVYLVLRGIRPGMLFDLGPLPEFQFKFIETILARGNGRVAALPNNRGIYDVHRPGVREAAENLRDGVSPEIATVLGYTCPSNPLTGLPVTGIDLSMGVRATPLTHSVHVHVHFEGGERTNIMTSLCLTREGAEIEYDSFSALAVVMKEAIVGLTFAEWTVENVSVTVSEFATMDSEPQAIVDQLIASHVSPGENVSHGVITSFGIANAINAYLVLMGIRPGMLFDGPSDPPLLFVEIALMLGSGRIAALHDCHGFYDARLPEVHEAANRLAEDHRVPGMEVSPEVSTILGYTYPAEYAATDIGAEKPRIYITNGSVPPFGFVSLDVHFEGGDANDVNIMGSGCNSMEGLAIEYVSFSALADKIEEAIVGLSFAEMKVCRVSVKAQHLVSLNNERIRS